ncbi:MAG: hypothetical protein OSA06_07650 [Acidimicrobiales bacterium]|nr:hypothetical protein [Acidimicrobiales bacterium]
MRANADAMVAFFLRRNSCRTFLAKRRWILTLTLVPLLTLWLDAPAGATDGHDMVEELVADDISVDHTVVQGPTEALEGMARQVASENDAPYEETLAMLVYQQKAGQLLTELDDSGHLPETFAGSEFPIDDPQTMIWYFKGEAPTGFIHEAAVAGVPGLSIKGSQRFSLNELIGLQDAAHDAVVEFGHNNVYSYFDLRTQKIILEVSDGTDQAGATQEREVFVNQKIQTALGLLDINIEIIDLWREPSVELMHAYGGAWFRDDGVDECTSAFIAYGAAGYGPLTAAHCEGLNQLADAGSGSSFSAAFASEHIGFWGDIEFHTSSHYSYAQFYISNTTRRTVTGRVANTAMSTNTAVCRYGRASANEDCGTVSAINTVATFFWGGNWVTARHMVDAINISGTGETVVDRCMRGQLRGASPTAGAIQMGTSSSVRSKMPNMGSGSR